MLSTVPQTGNSTPSASPDKTADKSPDRNSAASVLGAANAARPRIASIADPAPRNDEARMLLAGPADAIVLRHMPTMSAYFEARAQFEALYDRLRVLNASPLSPAKPLSPVDVALKDVLAEIAWTLVYGTSSMRDGTDAYAQMAASAAMAGQLADPLAAALRRALDEDVRAEKSDAAAMAGKLAPVAP